MPRNIAGIFINWQQWTNLRTLPTASLFCFRFHR